MICWFLKVYLFICLAASGPSCSTWDLCCGTWAYLLWSMWDLRTPARDWTHVPCIAWWILNYCTTSKSWFADIDPYLHSCNVSLDHGVWFLLYIVEFDLLIILGDFCIKIHQGCWFVIFFFILECFSLVLVSGYCWPHTMNLGVLPPLHFFGIIWEG